MSKGSEKPVELLVEARGITRCIVVLVHSAALLPLYSLPWQTAALFLLLVATSLFAHVHYLARRQWHRLVMQTGGNLMLLNRSLERYPCRLLACKLVGARISILAVQVAEQRLNLPVYCLGQSEAYRQLRRYLLKYPPGEMAVVSNQGDQLMSNGHRRSSGSVF